MPFAMPPKKRSAQQPKVLTLEEEARIRDRAKRSLTQRTLQRIASIVEDAVKAAGDSAAGRRLLEAYEVWRQQTNQRLKTNCKDNNRHRWKASTATVVEYHLQCLRGALKKRRSQPAALATLLVSQRTKLISSGPV